LAASGPDRAVPDERRCTVVTVLVIVLVVAAIVLVMFDVRYGSRRSSKTAPDGSAGPGQLRARRPTSGRVTKPGSGGARGRKGNRSR
jgi:hypothetical protein